MSSKGLSRRQILGLGVAGATFAALPTLSPASLGQKPRKKAKNIIFMVADGMAMSVPTMADHFQQLTTGKGSYWSWLQKQDFATNGLQDTRSLNSVVTDSSAASSSWGSGVHIWNSMVNMLADGTELTCIGRILQDKAKMRTGLVTTTTITHATPAGFAVSTYDRDDEALIATKLLDSGMFVLMGGGDKYFSPELRKDKMDLYAKFGEKVYAIAKDRAAALSHAKDQPLLGIFSNGHLPYSIDRNHSAEIANKVPTLAEMTAKAIEMLKRGKDGFLLQVEGGRVDHAGHSNDFGAQIYDQIAFEEAVKVAVEFALKDNETLVIITSDHATANPGLNGIGEEYIDSTEALKRLAQMTSSYEAMNKELTASKTADAVRDLLKSKLGVELSKAHAEFLGSAMNGESPLKGHKLYGSLTSQLGLILGNYTGVGWTSGAHTSDFVRVSAVGPGSELFKGITQNIHFFDAMLAHRGLKHTNPSMSLEEAKPYWDKKHAKTLIEAPHWI